jgi:hypothetical protein
VENSGCVANMQAVVEGERGHIAEYEDYMNWTKVRNYSKATASSPKLAIITQFIIHIPGDNMGKCPPRLH